jgi:hypothetical protein
MNIEKERFEAWLFSQPDDRTWNYCDNLGCVGCCFLKETVAMPNPGFGGDFYFEDMEIIGEEPKEIPYFLIKILRDVRDIVPLTAITAAALKTTWRKLNPEPEEPRETTDQSLNRALAQRWGE